MNNTPDSTAVLAALEQAALRASQDGEFQAACAGHEFELAICVVCGEQRHIISIPDRGGAGDVLLVLEAPANVWEEVMRTQPGVGRHSFTALSRNEPTFCVRGSSLHQAQALHAIERLFELFRGQVDHHNDVEAYPDVSNIKGRYALLRLADGVQTPIYWESSGLSDAPVLLMLHTAGADSRQFHAVMADQELQARWHLVAFDMPAHGRSAPLADTLWRDYRLSQTHYADVCHQFIAQQIKRPVVLMGCSMGAAMALIMAARHPEQLAGVIALEAPYRSSGRRSSMLAHAAVNQAAHNPAYVRGLMSPTSPLFWRRLATWIYSQSGHGIYAGDLVFYSDEFDAEVDLPGLDGTKLPISLMTGSYDYSATPEDSRRVAARIPGARFTEMPGLGHFPMIENPRRFLPYLKAELDWMASTLGTK